MKRRYQRVILVTLGVVFVVFLFAALLPHREPAYQGKRLSDWLEEVIQAGRLDKTGPASEAIRAMGTNALPFLLVQIEHQGSPRKSFLARLALKQSVLKLPFLESGRLFAPSLWAVRELGADAKPLIPDFAGLLEEADSARSWRGEMGLWAIGAEAKPALEKLCQSSSEHVRAKAALVLARVVMGASGDEVRRVWELEAKLGLRGVNVTGDGWAFASFESPLSGRRRFELAPMITVDVVVALGRNLRDKDAAVRRASAEALNRLGNQARPVVPLLLDALKDEVPAVREAAAGALRKIDPEAAAKAGVK